MRIATYLPPSPFMATWSHILQADHLIAECKFFLVMMIRFAVCMSARKWKCGHIGIMQEALPVFFSMLVPVTLLTRFPHFNLLSDFKLDGKYTSRQTKSAQKYIELALARSKNKIGPYLLCRYLLYRILVIVCPPS